MPANLPSPCCATPLQKGVKICAIVKAVIHVANAISSIVSIAITVAVLTGTIAMPISLGASKPVLEFISYASLSCSSIMIVLDIIQVVFAALLFCAAQNKDTKRCRIWIKTTVALTVASTIFSLLSFAVIGSVVTTYTIYMIWVVYAFMEEVKNAESGALASELMQPASVYGEPSEETLKQSHDNEGSPPPYPSSSVPSEHSTTDA